MSGWLVEGSRAPPEWLLGLWVPDSARLQRHDLRDLRRGAQAWDRSQIQQQRTGAKERGGLRINELPFACSDQQVAISVCRRCALPAVHLARGLDPGRGARGRLLADYGERSHRAGGVSRGYSHHPGGRLHHRPLHPSTDEERHCYQHREGQSPVAELSACR